MKATRKGCPWYQGNPIELVTWVSFTYILQIIIQITNSVSTLLQLVYNHLLTRQAGRRLLLEKEKEKFY